MAEQGPSETASPESFAQTLTKRTTGPEVLTENTTGVRTDQDFRTVLAQNPDKTTIVQFGSTFCAHCHEMLPHFVHNSIEFPQNKYVLAQLDFMDEEVKDIKYTPTFAFYKRRRKVDEFFGSDPQQLRDHIWLHSDDGSSGTAATGLQASTMRGSGSAEGAAATPFSTAWRPGSGNT